VLRAQSGDREAFEALLRRIHAPLRAYLSGMLGSSIADDAMQDTALQLYRKLRWLRDPEVFRAWVFRIASRIAFSHLKRERRWLGLDRDPEVLDSVADTVPPLRTLMSQQRFSQLLSYVSPASRAVLLLHYEQDLPLEQVAAVLAIPLGTVKSRLQYGLTTLRKHFKEEA
jgi:RNA polymerase sigma-70 factor (ECF subfamily)